jgi:SAM-dependent methyltransferase
MRLQESPPGFFTTPTRAQEQAAALSYPDDGHATCFGIEQGSFWFAHRNRCVTRTVLRMPPAGTLADVGGGNGFVARALLDAGVDVMLIEPGHTGAMNAWKRGVRPVVQATLDEANIAPASLGGIGLFDVVEHVEHDVAFLADCKSYLKPDGRVYITVPAHRALWSHEDDRAGHFRRYSRLSLHDTLTAAGFEVEYLTAFFAWLPLPVLLFRALPHRLGLVRHQPDVAHTAQEHALPSGVAGRVLQRLLDVEASAIERGGRIPVGGSLLAVARPASSVHRRRT